MAGTEITTNWLEKGLIYRARARERDRRSDRDGGRAVVDIDLYRVQPAPDSE